MAPPRLCAVPGCGRALYPGNWTGVCRAHNHAAGYCGCAQCADGSAPPPKPGPHRIRNREEELGEEIPSPRPVVTEARRKPGMPRPPWEDR